MMLPFTKMQGAGNDYIYVDAFSGPSPISTMNTSELAALAVRLSDRHFGVGADGLVLILPSGVADVRMRIFNADGSEAEMCGNATRCIGRYLVEHRLVASAHISLETLGGIKSILVAEQVTVDMGTELGNPHAVQFVDEITDEMVRIDGPRIERDPQYPHRANVEFVQVLDTHTIRMRVWERGSGETLACGTGACAAAREAIRRGYCESPVRVRLLGGELTIAVDPDGRMYKTGPAEIVFTGQIEI